MAKRILIVDDSKAMRMIVRRTLRQAGFVDLDVEEAASGVEALKMIETNPPHLVLSDWNMPDMSGYELLQQLREKQIKTPLGMITTEGTPEMRAKAAEAGARFLIQKPFTPEDMARALGEFLG